MRRLDGTILGRIVAQTAKDLEVRRLARREAGEDLTRAARQAPPPRDLLGALGAGARDRGLALLAELKPRSPSRGALVAGEPPVGALAQAYAAHADAMSVLCDAPFFGGGYPLLRRVRHMMDSVIHKPARPLPLLAKDFVIDPEQLLEARAAGADAVLLMASVLDPAELSELAAEAARLGLAALVETHDEAEIEVALSLGAPLVGVNSRDLRSLEIDLPRARACLAHLGAEAARRRTPVLRVAESGLADPSAVDATRGLAEACLIGSEIMTAPDPAARMTELGFPAHDARPERR